MTNIYAYKEINYVITLNCYQISTNDVNIYSIGIVSIYIVVQKRKVLAIVMRDIYNNLPQNIIIEFGV